MHISPMDCISWIVPDLAEILETVGDNFHTNTMHCLSSVYSVITPLHVSGVSAAHHQEVECIYVANGTAYTSE
jgi:hypothetical protein